MTTEVITKDTIKGAAIRELQNYKLRPLAGTTAATNIALAGTTVLGTTILSVLQYDPNDGGAGVGGFADLTSEAAITSDGNLQLDTTNTTGTFLLVATFDKA